MNGTRAKTSVSWRGCCGRDVEIYVTPYCMTTRTSNVFTVQFVRMPEISGRVHLEHRLTVDRSPDFKGTKAVKEALTDHIWIENPLR